MIKVMVPNSTPEFYLTKSGELLLDEYGGINPTDDNVAFVWEAAEVFQTPDTVMAFLSSALEKGVDREYVVTLLHSQGVLERIPGCLSKLGLVS